MVRAHYFIVAIGLLFSTSGSSYFISSHHTHVLGFVPHSINLSGIMRELSEREAWDLDFFNRVLSKRISLALVECTGAHAAIKFEKTFKESFLNILFHFNWMSQYGRERRAHDKKAQALKHNDDSNSDEMVEDLLDEVSVLFARLASQKDLEEINGALISGESSCTSVTENFVSPLQINVMKDAIESKIKTSFIDVLKERQVYMQIGWQGLIWGSAALEYLYGPGEFWSHFLEYAKIYFRVAGSALPVAIQLYNAHSRPLGKPELGKIAEHLGMVAHTTAATLDNATFNKDLVLDQLEISSLRQAEPAWLYDRYLLLKQMLITLIKSDLTPTHEKFFVDDLRTNSGRHDYGSTRR